MRSTKNLLLLLLAAFLLCTASYFAFRSYSLRKRVEVPQEDHDNNKFLALENSSEIQNETAPDKTNETTPMVLQLPESAGNEEEMASLKTPTSQDKQVSTEKQPTGELSAVPEIAPSTISVLQDKQDSVEKQPTEELSAVPEGNQPSKKEELPVVHEEQDTQAKGTDKQPEEDALAKKTDKILSESDKQNSEKEDDLEKVEGTLFLKTVLKEMECILGELAPTDFSCCGKLSLSDDGHDEKQACILLDSYKDPELELTDPLYRLRVVNGGELIIYEEVKGLPKPGTKCYPLKEKPGVDVCASVKYLSQEENVSDDLGYKSCALLKLGYGKEFPQDLVGRAEKISCDTKKEVLDIKGRQTPNAIQLELNLKSPIEEISEEVIAVQNENKENTKGDVEIEHSTPEAEKSNSSEYKESSEIDSLQEFLKSFVNLEPMDSSSHDETTPSSPVNGSSESYNEDASTENTVPLDPYNMRNNNETSASSSIIDWFNSIIGFMRRQFVDMIYRA